MNIRFAFEVLITALEYFCLFRLLSDKDDLRAHVRACLLSLPVTVMISAVNYRFPLAVVNLYLYFIYGFTVILISYRKNLLVKSVLLFVFLMLIGLCDVVSMLIVGAAFHRRDIAASIYGYRDPQRWIYLLVDKALLFLCTVSLRQWLRTVPALKADMLMIPFGLGSVFLAVLTFDFMKLHAVLGWAAYLIAGIFLLLILVLIRKWMRSETELSLMRMQSDAYLKYLDAIKESQERQAKTVHDFRHQCLTLRSFLTEGKDRECREYLDGLLEVADTEKYVSYTGNRALDFLLNYKRDCAAQAGISFLIDADFVENCVSTAADDINIIFGNLLDNALEAAAAVPDAGERKVLVKINRVHDMLFLTIKNTCRDTENLRNGIFFSSKTASGLHGIGLKNVQNRVKKNQGLCSFEEKDGVFAAKVTFFK